MSFLTGHRVTAVIVLIVASAWVLTGEFSAVGSEEPEAGEPATEAAPEVAAAARTVAAVKPVFAEYAREIRISGATEADKVAVLAARANGIVAALGVIQGQTIGADEVVLRLDGAEVEANVAQARASLAQMTEELDVGEALFARGSLPELERVKRRAAKSAAEAALSQAEAAADRLLLKAPFAGTVDSVEVERGEWVQEGRAIATVLALDPIVVKAEVSERDVAQVAVGAKALVRLVDGTEMEGTVRHVARQASDITRTFVVDVALPNADGKIPSGLTAEVRLFAAPQAAVTVPRSIITISEEGMIGLRVVGADNIAQFAPVTLIDDTADGLIVTGLPDDVRVIVAGQDLVRDGDPVIVTELTPEQAAEAAGKTP